MNFANKKLRLAAYLVDLLIVGLFVGLSIFWLFIFNVPFWVYLILGIGLWYIYFTVFLSLTYYFSNGKSLGNLIFKLKIAAIKEEKLTFNKCIIRSSLQAVFIFEIFSLYYSIKNNRHINIIDTLSDSYIITINY